MEKIGEYVVERELGRGGMGIVYRGRDPKTGNPVAIKVLPVQLAADPDFFNRFRREVQALSRLNHPGIVRILDHGTQDGSLYYVMEFVDGGSLEELLASEKVLNPLRAVKIIQAAAEALQHSHEHGVIHRDIKPSNILLTSDEQVKLTDFGIAKLTDATRLTATSSVLGTVEYMSPEQAQGRHVDARTDLYSLGVVLYRMVTGRLPITGTNPTEIMLKVRTHQVESPAEWRPDLPKNLVELIMRTLEKEPARRIESAQALVRELQRVRTQLEAGLEGQRPPPVSERVIHTAPEHEPGVIWQCRWIFIAIAFAVFVAFLAYRGTRKIPPEVRLERARKLIATDATGALSDALDELEALVKEHPEHALRAVAEEMHDELAPRLEARLTARRLFRDAVNCQERGNIKLAIQLYKLVIEHFPGSRYAEQALGRLVKLEGQASAAPEISTRNDFPTPAKSDQREDAQK